MHHPTGKATTGGTASVCAWLTGPSLGWARPATTGTTTELTHTPNATAQHARVATPLLLVSDDFDGARSLQAQPGGRPRLHQEAGPLTAPGGRHRPRSCHSTYGRSGCGPKLDAVMVPPTLLRVTFDASRERRLGRWRLLRFG